MNKEEIIEFYNKCSELFQEYINSGPPFQRDQRLLIPYHDLRGQIGDALNGKGLVLSNGKILIHNDERNELYEIELWNE